MNAQRLKGQAAWISGSTAGIGEGIARLFAEEGAAVTIVGRNSENGERVVKEIADAGGKAIFTPCNVGDSDAVKASIDATVDAFGGLNILVNNAAIQHVQMLHEFSEDEWDSQMNVNVKSMFLAFKYAFPHLRKNEKSYVVNVGSISSFVGQDRTPVYTTSKGAILQLSKSIALDYARFGIRCNCVCPGITDTPMLRKHLNALPNPDELLAERLRRVPLGTILTPNDVAKSILFLACDDSSGITGTSLLVDGGYLAAAEWDCQQVAGSE